MKKLVPVLGFEIRWQVLADHTPGKQGARAKIWKSLPVESSDYPDVLAQIETQFGFHTNDLLIQDGSGDIYGAQARPKLDEEDEKKGKKVGKTLLELRVAPKQIVYVLKDVPDATDSVSEQS